jgi:hypothetical protein
LWRSNSDDDPQARMNDVQRGKKSLTHKEENRQQKE